MGYFSLMETIPDNRSQAATTADLPLLFPIPAQSLQSNYPMAHSLALRLIFSAALAFLPGRIIADAAPFGVEAEAFARPGGGVLDTQFIEPAGSPCLMAHGMGNSVADAGIKVTMPSAGKYRVRGWSKNWVGPWPAPGSPGRFGVALEGTALEHGSHLPGILDFKPDAPSAVTFSATDGKDKIHIDAVPLVPARRGAGKKEHGDPARESYWNTGTFQQATPNS